MTPTPQQHAVTAFVTQLRDYATVIEGIARDVEQAGTDRALMLIADCTAGKLGHGQFAIHIAIGRTRALRAMAQRRVG